MVWEMLYCVMFFVVPIVGMVVAIGVEAFRGKPVELSEIRKDANRVIDLEAVIGNVLKRSYYDKGMRPRENFAQGALVIDLDAYRKKKYMERMKGQVYPRAGPIKIRYDTS